MNKTILFFRLIIFLFLCVLPLFHQERICGMENIILTTKKGRKMYKMISVKLFFKPGSDSLSHKGEFLWAEIVENSRKTTDNHHCQNITQPDRHSTSVLLLYFFRSTGRFGRRNSSFFSSGGSSILLLNGSYRIITWRQVS